MTKRFPLSSSEKYVNAPLHPEFEALYMMIRADMSTDVGAAAYFIGCIQNIASGKIPLAWYETFERDNLTLAAVKIYTHAA